MTVSILALVPRPSDSELTAQMRGTLGLEAAARFMAHADNHVWENCSVHAQWFYRERARLIVHAFVEGSHDQDLSRNQTIALLEDSEPR